MAVNKPLTPKRRSKRPRRYVETWEYLDMLGRMIRAAGPRVGRADMDEFRKLVELRDDLDAAIEASAAEVRENGGYSWADIGEVVGLTRQGAQQRYGRRRKGASK